MTTTESARPKDEVQIARPKIVIVDDDEVLIGTAAALLERAGFEVATCATSFNRLNFIMEHKPDLVLLDVNMPMVTGDEIFRLMQDHSRLRDFPVVFFSSNEEGELRRLVNQTGARGFISKSEVGSNFAAKVARMLERIRSSAPRASGQWPRS